MKSLLLFAVLTANSITAGEKFQIEREGAQWNVTVSGVLPPQDLNRIVGAGDLTIRGKRSNEIRYTVTRKIFAPDEATARRTAQRDAQDAVRLVDGQLIFTQRAAARVEIPRASSSLALMSVTGMVDAADIEGSVRVDTAAGSVMLDRIGGDVEIHSGGGPTLLGTIGGLVRCYSGGGPIHAVRIKGGAIFETDGGDIHLGEVLGVVRAITAAGGIRIDRAGAQVFADTFGGPISILRALGLVVANSSGGPIDIDDAPSVECRSASGTIRLNNVSGHLRAATGRGSIVAEILPGHPLENSSLSARGGDITVLIPSDMGVTIEAETDGSRNPRSIVSDFSGLRIISGASSVVARGSLNGGGPTLRLTGTDGRIEIKRK